jgi:hypothetical protein
MKSASDSALTVTVLDRFASGLGRLSIVNGSGTWSGHSGRGEVLGLLDSHQK